MTEPRDTEWGELFRASMPAEPEGACPSSETLWSAARGELPAGEMGSLATHLTTCAACGEALAVSAELVAEDTPQARAWSPRPLSRLRAAVAGITAVAAGLLVYLAQREPAPPDRRGPELAASRGEASAAIRSLSKEEQPASEPRLQWTPVDQAVRYRVQVSTEDLRPVYDGALEGTTLALPPQVGGAKQAGQPFLWQVEALLPDGRTVTSPTFKLRLVPVSPGAPR